MSDIPAISPFFRVQIDIARDEDWYDPLPQLAEQDGTPIDLTGADLRLTIRPTFDHAVKLLELSADAGVFFDDPARGLAHFAVTRADIQAALPLRPNGEAASYDHFLVLDQPGRFPRYREIWRGPLVVHPARTA